MTQLLRRRIFAFGIICAIGLTSSGCGKKGFLERVEVVPSADLQQTRVSLFFKKDIQLLLAGTIPVHKYGHIYMNPWTSASPFEMGFTLNRAIFNDPGYINLKPTAYLPNGAPTGLPYPVIEISGDKPISANFNLYGYADMEHQAWLGMAGIFSISGNTDIPSGTTLTQVFKRDAYGNASVFASVFGPVTATDGTLIRQAGLALFANVKALAASVHERKVLKPEKKVYISSTSNIDHLTSADLIRLRHELVIEANKSVGH